MVVMAATFAVLIGTDPAKLGALSHAFSRPPPVRAPEHGLRRDPHSRERQGTSAAGREQRRSVAPSASAAPPKASYPDVWRVAELSSAPGIKMVEGTMERRSFVEALGEARGAQGADLPAPRGVRKRASLRQEQAQGQLRRRARHAARARSAGSNTRSRPPRFTRPERETTDRYRPSVWTCTSRRNAPPARRVGDDIAASLKTRGSTPRLLDLLDDALGRARAALELARWLAATHRGRIRDGARRVRALRRHPGGRVSVGRPRRGTAARLPPAQQQDLGLLRRQRAPTLQRRISHARSRSRGSLRASTCAACTRSCTSIMPHNGVDFASPSGTPGLCGRERQ